MKYVLKKRSTCAVYMTLEKQSKSYGELKNNIVVVQ